MTKSIVLITFSWQTNVKNKATTIYVYSLINVFLFVSFSFYD